MRSIVFLTDKSSFRSTFLFEGQNDQQVIWSLFMTKMESKSKDFEITGYPCNMTGSQRCDLFMNRTIFCSKSCWIYHKLALISYAHCSIASGRKTAILRICTLFIWTSDIFWCDQYKQRRVGNIVMHTSDWSVVHEKYDIFAKLC